MKDFFQEANWIQEKLNGMAVKAIPLSIEVLFQPCSYTEEYEYLPSVTHFQPFEKDTRWGGKKDEHAWFYTKVDLRDYMGKTVRMFAHTDRHGEDIWDACNPQFIVYKDGKIVQGMDVKHTFVDFDGGEENEFFFYAQSGTEVEGPLDFCLRFCEVDHEVEKLAFDIFVAVETLKLCNTRDIRYAQMQTALWDIFKTLEFRDEEIFRDGLRLASKKADEYFFRFKAEGEKPIVTVGSTHIDIAWLWRIRQTEEKAIRSFSTALYLMEKYPEYNFFSSQPILYEMLRRRTPTQYEKLRQRVMEGRWETDGGMWVESDCNLPSGESLVRQFLYGKKYFQENFNVDSKIAWLVDSFGFNGALPQILAKSGIDFFVTSKLSWNDTNTMPADLFYWEGIDGTRIPAYFISTQFATKENEFNPFTIYNAYVKTAVHKGSWERFRQREISGEILMPFGYGDGGGGPAHEQFEHLQRMENGTFGCPGSKMGTVRGFFDRLLKKLEDTSNVPSWRGELYLEFHRGVYTSIAKVKKQNRKNEYRLQNAEASAVLARLLLDKEYPQLELEDAWKRLLTVQFHDILPGSAIKEVYDETDRLNGEIVATAGEIIQKAFESIANCVAHEEGVVVFNTNGYTASGNVVVGDKNYWVEDIPAMGYRFVPKNDLKQISYDGVVIRDKKLENAYLSVIFDKNYNIASIYDKNQKRELLKDGELANRLVLYEDHPSQYDAWELDNYYGNKKKYIDEVSKVETIETADGKGFKITKRYLQTVVEQIVTLTDDSRLLRFDARVDWRERHMLLKVEFPLALNTDKAVCDIAFGNIERSTTNNTSWDKAKFEVCAHKFVDLSENNYGVALINDCKYGYGIKNCELSLSLLRAPEYPYEGADYGEHEFVYALYPHENNVYNSDVYQKALFLNNPLIGIVTKKGDGRLPNSFSLVSVDKENVVVDGVKQSENGKGFIVRMFEQSNTFTNTTVRFGANVKRVYLCDLMENTESELANAGNLVQVTLKPYEIVTLYVEQY